MALAISCDQDISVDDGSRGKKSLRFLLENAEKRRAEGSGKCLQGFAGNSVCLRGWPFLLQLLVMGEGRGEVVCHQTNPQGFVPGIKSTPFSVPE